MNRWTDEHRQTDRQTDMTKPFAIFQTQLDKNVKTAINKVHGQN